MDLADLLHRRGHAILQEVQEGLDRGQADVARTRTIRAGGFQVPKEVDHQRRVDLLQVQLGWRDVETRAGEFKEQLERICIRVRRVGAGTAFEGKAVLEEGGEVWRERRHGHPPVTKRSHWSATACINSGTASRYQYVSATVLCPR